VELNNLPMQVPIPGRGNIVVVTGWRNVGKTTYCQEAVSAYQQAGLNVSGLLTVGRFMKDQKTGFFALDLQSNQQHLFASKFPAEFEGPQFGSWTFNPPIFAWGNRCLEQADGTDVLVIDELGPLEFKKNIGWVSSFELLKRKNFQLALVVVRPEFLDAFANSGFSFMTHHISNLNVINNHLASTLRKP